MKKIALVIGLVFSMQVPATEILWYVVHVTTPWGSGFNSKQACEDYIRGLGSAFSCVPIVKNDR